MIKLEKGAKPSVLVSNADRWRDELLGHLRAGTPVPSSLASSYNHDEVKAALNAECHGKCMYCESKINHVTYAHIEHYRPKRSDMFPEFTFEWENLGLACPVCNVNKSDTFDAAAPFINPYSDEPTTHFRPEGPFVRPVPGDLRAEITELELELNRPELIERRQERLDRLRDLVRCYRTEQNAALKQALLERMEEEIATETEFSFVAAAHVRLFVPSGQN